MTTPAFLPKNLPFLFDSSLGLWGLLLATFTCTLYMADLGYSRALTVTMPVRAISAVTDILPPPRFLAPDFAGTWLSGLTCALQLYRFLLATLIWRKFENSGQFDSSCTHNLVFKMRDRCCVKHQGAEVVICLWWILINLVHPVLFVLHPVTTPLF